MVQRLTAALHCRVFGDFVMGRVDFAVGAHDGENAAAPTRAEFPRDAIREAIVNAVCHRDYTSNACVQVMLFRDRLEIINPGPLPQGISVKDLYRTHDSVPRNSLIARAMSWTSYVEKSGSGTGVIIDKCTEHGLARPEFDPTSGFFRTIIWRTGSAAAKGLVAGASWGLVKGSSQGAQSRGPVRGPSQGAQSRGRVGGPSQRGRVGAHDSRRKDLADTCRTSMRIGGVSDCQGIEYELCHWAVEKDILDVAR